MLAFTLLFAALQLGFVAWGLEIQDLQGRVATVPPNLPLLLPSGWDSLYSCVADSWQQGQPFLTISWGQNTPASCAWACQLRNYPVAAVSNGNICTCAAGTGTAANMTVSVSQCATACAGDAEFLCGGSSTHQMFQTTRLPMLNTVLEPYQDPFGNSVYHLSLPCAWSGNGIDYTGTGSIVESGKHEYISRVTPAHCITYCAYTYETEMYPLQIIAVDDGLYCQCGGFAVTADGIYIAGYRNYTVPAVIPQEFCNIECAGYTGISKPSPAKSCGGQLYASTYSGDYNPSYWPIAPLTWPWDTITCANLDPNYTGTNTEVFANPHSVTLNDTITPAWCTAYCAAGGYTLAGVEAGNTCACGTGYTTLPYTDDPFDCFSMPCTGNASLACGSAYGNRIIYAALGPAPPPSIGLTLPTGWTVLAWCSTLVNASQPLVSNALATTLATNSPQACSAYCAGLSYMVAVVQIGTGCVCGTALVGNLTATDIWDCIGPCPGGSGTCGNAYGYGARVQIYGHV